MSVEPIKFTDEIKELVGLDALEFYGATEKGRKITCMVQKQALEDFFDKSINEDFKSCFSRMKFFILNIARVLVYNNEFNSEGVYDIDNKACMKYKHLL
jgi:hypothetical protein